MVIPELLSLTGHLIVYAQAWNISWRVRWYAEACAPIDSLESHIGL